ncbi:MULTISPECIES: hypothetical protein [Serratia]
MGDWLEEAGFGADTPFTIVLSTGNW